MVNGGKNNHRNGAKVLPTSDRGDISRPHNYASSITNTPEPLLYGISVVLIVFGITFLIIGSVYISKCELQPMLPIWLLLMGIISALIGIIYALFVMRTKKEPFRRVHMMEKVSGILVVLVFMGWFIAGNFWVYKAWGEEPDYGHTWFDNGCNKSVFILSFCAIITLDAIVGLLLIGFCFWGVTKVIVRE